MAPSLVQALLLAFSAPLANHDVAMAQAGVVPRIPTRPTPLGGGVPLRIMPLGASITYGLGSSDQSGYRGLLRSQLKSSHTNPVNMVGTFHAGAMVDNEVEGWSGYFIDAVREKAAIAVPKWKPNIVLINVGTNDARSHFAIESASLRIEALVNQVWRDSPCAAILLSTLPINRDTTVEPDTQIINFQYAALVDRLQIAGRKIALVDMHGPLGPSPASDDYSDEQHPNDKGYAKMANLWHEGLIRVSDAKWIQAPEPVHGLADNGEDDGEDNSGDDGM